MKNIEKLSPTAAVLFCGVGGCSLGLQMAGFKELIAIDSDSLAQKNFELNFPDILFWKTDIWKLKGVDIMQRALIQKGELDLLVTTPPCQGFSIASGKADPLDFRNGLFLHSLDLISEILPKSFIIENVPGMNEQDALVPIMNEIKLRIKERLPEYQVYCFKVNCLFFGVPSGRERLIFLGILKGKNTKIPNLKSTTPDIDQFRINKVAPSIQQISFGQSKKIIRLSNDFMPTLTATEGIKIFENGTWKSLSEHEGYLKMFNSFPADFKLEGSNIEKHKLIGNAVPPMLMKHIAEYMKTEILGYSNKAKNLSSAA